LWFAHPCEKIRFTSYSDAFDKTGSASRKTPLLSAVELYGDPVARSEISAGMAAGQLKPHPVLELAP